MRTAAVVIAPDAAPLQTFWIGFGVVGGLFALIELARLRVFFQDRRERGLWDLPASLVSPVALWPQDKSSPT